MKALKVSIIIDNFNYDRYLKAAVDSALNQTYNNCEVIVVDDGSTDNSRAILKTYGDEISVILKENGGQSSAFNAGFSACSGALIGFLDSDDILLPEAVEQAARAWQEGIAKVQFPLQVLGPDGQGTGLLMPRAALSAGDVLRDYLRTGRYVASPTSGNLFSRQLLEAIFPIPEEDWAQTGDGYINTAAPFFGSIVAINRPLGLYRSHGESMSSVCYNGKLNLSQMEKLLRHANLERALLFKLARERGLTVSKRAVVSHWMYLKLRISFDKLAETARFKRFGSLLSNGFKMFRSLLTTNDLPFRRKLQYLLWTLCVVFLPRSLATRAIAFGFQQAPQSGISLRLRRA